MFKHLCLFQISVISFIHLQLCPWCFYLVSLTGISDLSCPKPNLIFSPIQIIPILKFLKFTNLRKSHSHSFSCLNHNPNSHFWYTLTSCKWYLLYQQFLLIVCSFFSNLLTGTLLHLQHQQHNLFTDFLTWTITILLIVSILTSFQYIFHMAARKGKNVYVTSLLKIAWLFSSYMGKIQVLHHTHT